MVALEAEHAALLLTIAPQSRASARNLLHYLAMRQPDLRDLQTKLAAIGLSSLGRAESHALSAVDAVLHAVRRLANEPTPLSETAAPCDLNSGASLLDANTTGLLGPEPQGRTVRVMVTMPSEAADNYTLVRNLLEAGMDCMRINCAHDEPEAWLKMIQHLHQARETLGRPCAVLMDLAGPKLRTGEVEPGPAVLKIRPTRDAMGMVTAPARRLAHTDRCASATAVLGRGCGAAGRRGLAVRAAPAGRSHVSRHPWTAPRASHRGS